MFRYIVLYLILSVFLFQDIFAKDDHAAWVAAGVYIPWSDKWKTLVYGEFRSKDYIRKTDLISISALTHYRVSPYLRIGAGYDLFFNKLPSQKGFEDEHRLLAETILQYDYAGFTLGWRARVLTLFMDIKDHTWYLRNRFKFDYRFKSSLNPYISVEPYLLLSGWEYYKNRWIGGVTYDFRKHQPGIYYLAEKKNGATKVLHVLAMEYYYTF